MNERIRRLLTLLAAMLLLCGCVSCGGPAYSEEELRAALEELLPRAAVLNGIYFGEGLPLSDDRAALDRFFGSFDSDLRTVNYNPVDEACGWTSEAQIREETLEVFTAEYAEYLFDRAFAGISEVFNEGTETQTTETAMYAMYIEQNGILTARIDLADHSLLKGSRSYRTEEMRLDHEGDGYAVVIVPTDLDGEPDEEIELKLVKTAAGWRLDSPTY